MINQLKDVLKVHFKLKDLGDLQYFLGLNVARSKEMIVLCQQKYVLELIAKRKGCVHSHGTKPEVNYS